MYSNVIPLNTYMYLFMIPLNVKTGTCEQSDDTGHKILCTCVQLFSRVPIFAILLSIACQAPLSTEFSRQEYWSALPFSTPGDLPNPGIKLMASASPAFAGRFFTTALRGKPHIKF